MHTWSDLSWAALYALPREPLVLNEQAHGEVCLQYMQLIFTQQFFGSSSFSAVLLFRQFFTTSVTPIGMIRTSLYVVEFHLVQRCTNPFIPTFIKSIGECCICPTKEALVVIWVKVREEYKLPIATVEKLVGDFNGKPTLVITILPRI